MTDLKSDKTTDKHEKKNEIYPLKSSFPDQHAPRDILSFCGVFDSK
jgi:hypothetical protein